MRWAGQEISSEAGDRAALPGLESLHTLVRSVRTPEFAGITFHEVLAKSALNHVPKAAGLPFNWTVNPYRGCSHGCACWYEVPGLLVADVQFSRRAAGGVRGGEPGLEPVAERAGASSGRGRRIPETWIGAGVWPVRPRDVTSNVITPRSSANLVLPPLLVVLDLPVVTPDHTKQISHGSPSSTSAWIAHG